ncbi:MAG TPA: hypothetical protein VMU32_06425 [Solirubrobacteraceae bacterium]|nr:hypothetical protein [Solirubrobacteraceae bacterium]
MSALRMGKSPAEIEEAFAQEITRDRERREMLRRTAEQRALKREVQRRNRRGSLRYVALVFALIATAAIVTVVMFQTLYLLLS